MWTPPANQQQAPQQINPFAQFMQYQNLLPMVAGFIGSAFQPNRQASLLKFYQDMMRARLVAQDNAIGNLEAQAGQGRADAIASRANFHEGQIIENTRNYMQNVQAGGGGLGEDTRVDVQNAAIQSAGQEALNRDTAAIDSNYFNQLATANAQRDPGAAIQAGIFQQGMAQQEAMSNMNTLNGIMDLMRIGGQMLDYKPAPAAAAPAAVDPAAAGAQVWEDIFGFTNDPMSQNYTPTTNYDLLPLIYGNDVV